MYYVGPYVYHVGPSTQSACHPRFSTGASGLRGGISIVPACASRRFRHTKAAIGTTPHTATTGCFHLCQAIAETTIACNRHYSTGTIEGPQPWTPGRQCKSKRGLRAIPRASTAEFPYNCQLDNPYCRYSASEIAWHD